MTEQILQINFGLNVSPTEYRAFAASVAQTVASVPGLRWKMWFLNEDTREAGGIYLFEDERTLKAYLSSDIIQTVRTHPALKNATFTHAPVMSDLTALTRGPVGATVTA